MSIEALLATLPIGGGWIAAIANASIGAVIPLFLIGLVKKA